MNYEKLLKDCITRAEAYRKCGAAWNLTHEENCAIAITDLLRYKDAIERMGEFGKLFLSYTGDPRGPVGRSGDRDIAKEVQLQPVIIDVDGGKWRPVNEDALQDLLRQLDRWKERNFRSCMEKGELSYRAEAAERERDELREAMKPNCLLCDSMHENGNCTEVGGFCTSVPAAHCPLIPKLRQKITRAEARTELLENANRILSARVTAAEARIEQMKNIMRAEGIAVIPGDIAGEKANGIGKRKRRNKREALHKTID